MKWRGELNPAALIWLLGVSQVIGYGTLEYSFAILVADIGESFGWSISWLFGSFSLALLAGAVVAPPVGRLIDRHGGGPVMAFGSSAAAVTLVAVGLSPNPIVFTISLIAVQLAAAMVLYDAAFAVLAQTTGAEARLRITHLTLIAGFASTIFWPLTSWLNGMFEWRAIFFGFAMLNIAVCAPMHLLIALHHRRSVAAAVLLPQEMPESIEPVALPTELQRRLVFLVTIGFALAGFTLAAVLNQMVPLLTSLGLGTSALIVATLFGPAQVLVRLVNMLIGIRRHPMAATLIALALMPVALLLLVLSAPWAIGAVVFALMLGFSSGLVSIVHGTLPLALFGKASYGVRLGWMAFARQGLAAASPFVLAWLIETIGPTHAVFVLVSVACLGLLALLEGARLHRSASVRPVGPAAAG